MAFALTDVTSNAQRLAADNATNVELGSGTPSAPLSVQGVPIIQSGVIANSTVTSGAVQRVTGSLILSAGTQGTVVMSGLAGFGSIDNGAIIIDFEGGNGFDVANPPSNSNSAFDYTVF